MNLAVRTPVIACLSALLMLGGCEQSADADPATSSTEATLRISGAGSSFAAPIFNKWFEVYASAHPDLALDYDSVGSGEGIDRFLAGNVDIGATDAPLRPDHAAEVGGPYLQLPVTAGMIAIAYNLPGVDGRLNLPRDVYVDIFRGTLKRWDDARIAAANPGVALPPKQIQVVARQDPSGTTFAFTNHLATISDQWSAGVGKLIDWPGGSMLARGNEGVAGRIKTAVGAVGYVEAGFAQRLQLPLAWLENQSGGLVAPNAEGAQLALAGGADAKPKDLSGNIIDPPGARSYPIVNYTWALLRTGHSDDAAEGKAVAELMRWVLSDGQSYAEALWYVPLPDNLVQVALAQLETGGN